MATTGGPLPIRVTRRSSACQFGFVAGIDIGNQHGSAVEIDGVAAAGKPLGDDIETDLRTGAEGRADGVLEHRVGGDDDHLAWLAEGLGRPIRMISSSHWKGAIIAPRRGPACRTRRSRRRRAAARGRHHVDTEVVALIGGMTRLVR